MTRYHSIVTGRITPYINSVQIGMNATFECITNTTANWSFNDGDIPANAKIIDSVTLLIQDIKSENKGYYECEGKTSNNKTFFSDGILKILGQ